MDDMILQQTDTPSILPDPNDNLGFLQLQVLSAYSNTPISGAAITVRPVLTRINQVPSSDLSFEPSLDPFSEQISNQEGNLLSEQLSEQLNSPASDNQENAFPGIASFPAEYLYTDSSGQTEDISLPAPPLRYSESPSEVQPYSEYRLRIEADGYEPLDIIGTEIFTGQRTIQPVALRPIGTPNPLPTILIPPNTLFGVFPSKIPEAEIKPLEESGEIVLSRVVVPETIVVHDGAPDDLSAADYFVPYRDYIKNVASSEIYSTWPRATITANVLVIMSFTLNRVFTEWYRNRGYNFTITSSTAYDQKWSYGRNIFDSISEVVDEIFTAYLSRPDVRQPLFTQYCDGNRVSCPGWLSQWGSKSLGDQGYSAIEILRYYYGEDIYINTAEEISGIPFSWPGNNLDIGSSGQKVYQLQEQLNTIATAYPAIPTVVVDGIYGERTREAIARFQSVFGLPSTGVTDYATWFKVSEIYVAVSKIAERI